MIRDGRLPGLGGCGVYQRGLPSRGRGHLGPALPTGNRFVSVRRASHFGLCCADLEKSVRFYTQVFGFIEISRLAFQDESTRTLLDLPTGELEAVYAGLELRQLHPDFETEGLP